MAGNPCAMARSMTMRRLKENIGAVSTFNAAAPDALALSIAGAIWSGRAGGNHHELDAVRTAGVLKGLQLLRMGDGRLR